MVRANFLANCEDVLKRRGEWVAPSKSELDDPLLYAALKKALRRVAPKFRKKAESALWWKLNGHNFLHLKRVHENAMTAKAAVELMPSVINPPIYEQKFVARFASTRQSARRSLPCRGCFDRVR
jgi:hypothetical protein